jgi:hypothetical protein
VQALSRYRGTAAPYHVDVLLRTVFTWHVQVVGSQPLPGRALVSPGPSKRLRRIRDHALLRDTLNAP